MHLSYIDAGTKQAYYAFPCREGLDMRTVLGLAVAAMVAGPAMAGQLTPPLDEHHPVRPIPRFTTPTKDVHEWAYRTIAVFVTPYIRKPCNYLDFGHLSRTGDPKTTLMAAWLNQEAKLAAISAGCTYDFNLHPQPMPTNSKYVTPSVASMPKLLNAD